MGHKIQNTQDKLTAVNLNYWDNQGDHTVYILTFVTWRSCTARLIDLSLSLWLKAWLDHCKKNKQTNKQKNAEMDL